MSGAGDLKKVTEYFFTKDTENVSKQNPRLIFVFASPGAGKSTSVKPILAKSFTHSNPVMLEIDELKALSSDAKNSDLIRNIFLACVNKAIEEKRSLIIFRQRCMLEPNLTKHIYQKAKANGYQTQATFLALDIKRSRLGMIYRYEKALKASVESNKFDITNYPRKPCFMRHYIFFKMLPIVALACKKSKNIDIINVYDREGNLLAEDNRINNSKTKKDILQAIIQERSRSWSKSEINKFNARREETENSIKARTKGLLEVLKLKIFTGYNKR